jgi:hypothetical protein
VKCIICHEEKPKELFSEEHVFPDSIGGTLIIKSVCKKCNSYLGDHVDTHLVNHWLIQGIRQTLKIPGKSGKIPNPYEKAVLDSDPSQQVRCIFDVESILKPYMVTNIKKSVQNDGKVRYQIKVDKSDKEKIPGIINTILRRKGLPEFAREEIEKHSKVNVEPFPTLKKTFVIDTVQYQRAILKIAYELAWYWLGDSYLNDTTGVIIHNCMCDEGLKVDYYKKYTFKGRIKQINGSSFIPLPFLNNEHNSHIAFLMELNGTIVCYIKVFNIFEGGITISDNVKNYPRFEEKFIIINPQTGVTRESNLIDEIIRIGRINNEV